MMSFHAPLAFRPVNLADAPALLADCWSDRAPGASYQFIQRVQRFAREQRGLGLVLPQDGHILAYGQVTKWRRCAEISDLVVSEAYRNRGIGSALVQQLSQTASAFGVDYIEIGAAQRNRRALALYRRLGFEDAYEVSLNLGQGLEPVLYLRKHMTLHQ